MLARTINPVYLNYREWDWEVKPHPPTVENSSDVFPNSRILLLAFEQLLNTGKEAISPYVTNFTNELGSTRDRSVAFVLRLTLCG